MALFSSAINYGRYNAIRVMLLYVISFVYIILYGITTLPICRRECLRLPYSFKFALLVEPIEEKGVAFEAL